MCYLCSLVSLDPLFQIKLSSQARGHLFKQQQQNTLHLLSSQRTSSKPLTQSSLPGLGKPSPVKIILALLCNRRWAAANLFLFLVEKPQSLWHQHNLPSCICAPFLVHGHFNLSFKLGFVIGFYHFIFYLLYLLILVWK